jgi:hypothetical protein
MAFEPALEGVTVQPLIVILAELPAATTALFKP